MPLLLLQVCWARINILKLPEALGKRSGQYGEGVKLKLLIIGDSAAAGVGVNEQKDGLAGQLTANLAAKYKVEWSLIANTGFTSTDLIKELTALTEQTFDYVLVSVGVNDVTHLTRANHWSNNIRTIAKLLDTKFGTPKVLLTSVPPIQRFTAIPSPLRWLLGLRAKRLNELLINASKGKKHYSLLTFNFPFEAEFLAKDGIHPSKLAYSVWANQAAAKIDELY